MSPAPPKTPRAVTVNRDVRETKAPPTGSPAAMALARQEAVPEAFDPEEPTSPHANDFEKMQERVQRGAHHSKVAADQITQVRTEFREDLGRVHDRVDVMGENLGELRDKVSGMDGKLDVLVKFVEKQADTQLQTQTLTLTAKLEGEKAQQLSEVKVTEAFKLDVVEGKKWRRAAVLQFAAALGSGGAITILIAAVLGKC